MSRGTGQLGIRWPFHPDLHLPPPSCFIQHNPNHGVHGVAGRLADDADGVR
jgi:hypothetical protein